MNNNNGALELLTPGISLRIIDSYRHHCDHQWPASIGAEVDTSLSTVVTKYINAGLMKIPPGMFRNGITSFVNSLAQIIYTYKVATHRTALSAN